MRKQLSQGDRQYIEIALRKHVPVSEIAKDLNRHRSTIYKEIKKGTFIRYDSGAVKDRPTYGFDVAQRKIEENKKHKGRKLKLLSNHPYLKNIAECVQGKKYSLQAAQYILQDNPVSLTTLYHYLHKQYIPGLTENHMPYCVKKKKIKQKHSTRLPAGTSIEQRPEYINNRSRFGDWEMDTVYSSKADKACVLTMIERQTRYQLWYWIPNRTANSVINVMDSIENSIGTQSFRKLFKSITCDNGVEFSDYESLEKSISSDSVRTKIYKCHPYASSERGSNENGNRFLRRWVPKGDDFSLYSPAEIIEFQNWANNYPRKMFNGMSALQYFTASIAGDTP